MRFGICTSVDNALWARKTGFDYIELPVSTIGQLNAQDFAHAKAELETAGIRAERFNLLFPKTMSLIEDNAGLQVVKDWLETSFGRMQEMGGTVAVFGSGKCRNLPQYMDFASGFARLVAVVKLAGEIASRYGISLAIEPLNRGETNMVNSVTEGALLAYCADRANVGVLADWYHMTVENEPAEHIFMVKKILHTHIAQGKLRQYPSGSGEELVPFFEALKRAGYDGTMSIEGKTDALETDGPAALVLLRELAEKGERV